MLVGVGMFCNFPGSLLPTYSCVTAGTVLLFWSSVMLRVVGGETSQDWISGSEYSRFARVGRGIHTLFYKYSNERRKIDDVH